MILLIIIGIILIIVGYSFKDVTNPLSKFSRIFSITGFVIIFLGIISSTFKQIDAGKVGVKSLYGNVQSDVLESGFDFVIENPSLEIQFYNSLAKSYTRINNPTKAKEYLEKVKKIKI